MNDPDDKGSNPEVVLWTVLVQMVSAAGTGYCFNTKRNRLREKLVLRKNDPLVNKHVLFHEKKKIRSI